MNRTMNNLLDKHGNLMLFDAAGNRVTLAGNPHFIERSRHNKMLAEHLRKMKYCTWKSSAGRRYLNALQG